MIVGSLGSGIICWWVPRKAIDPLNAIKCCLRASIFVAHSIIHSTAKLFMKTLLKYLPIVFFFCLNLHTSNAQMNDGARFGLVAGINGASLYDDTHADDKKTRIGYTVGVFGQFPLVKGRLSIRPELLFSAKGATFNFMDSLSTRPKIKLSYVELPVSLQWHVFGFLNGNPLTFNFDKNDYSNIDYGFHVGAGLDLGNIGVHLRVTRGLKEVADKGSIKGYLGNLKNATWALTLGWAF
jgi:Outer membrane protein beta-barrel domain